VDDFRPWAIAGIKVLFFQYKAKERNSFVFFNSEAAIVLGDNVSGDLLEVLL
jgi:hypothetical protein